MKQERMEFLQYEKELREELLMGENIFLTSAMSGHEFGNLLFNKAMYHDEFEDIVPRDSAYDCICNFVDFRQDNNVPMPYKRNIASVHFVDSLEYVKVKVSCGYITMT